MNSWTWTHTPLFSIYSAFQQPFFFFLAWLTLKYELVSAWIKILRVVFSFFSLPGCICISLLKRSLRRHKAAQLLHQLCIHSDCSALFENVLCKTPKAWWGSSFVCWHVENMNLFCSAFFLSIHLVNGMCCECEEMSTPSSGQKNLNWNGEAANAFFPSPCHYYYC